MIVTNDNLSSFTPFENITPEESNSCRFKVATPCNNLGNTKRPNSTVLKSNEALVDVDIELRLIISTQEIDLIQKYLLSRTHFPLSSLTILRHNLNQKLKFIVECQKHSN